MHKFKSLPAGLTSIDSKSFINCTALTSIVIPSSVKTISSNAFEKCTSLKSFIVEENSAMTYISCYALYNCNAVETLVLPFVGERKNGSSYTCVGSVFGAKDYSDHSTRIPTTLKTISITGGTTIADYAFKNCSSVETIIISGNVASVGSNVFESCTNLKSLTLGDNITSYGSNMLKYCNNLTTLSVPFIDGHVAKLYSPTQTSTPSTLKTVKVTNTTTIPEKAFNGCYYIQTIELPNNIKYIGENAFYNCGSLTYNVFDNAKYLGNSENPYLVLVSANSTDISSCKIHESTRIIMKEAFLNCVNLTEISIPASVVTIGTDAFKGCTGLTKTTIASVESWLNVEFISSQYSNPIAYSHKVYVGNEELKELNIPSSITSISMFAFYDCSSLTSIYVPNTLTSIGSWAFFNCANVKTITFEENSKLESINNGVFKQCSGITEIIIPNSVNYLGDYVFRDCANLTKITLPSNIEFIGAELLCNCRNITEIIIPSAVTEIRQFAFFSCNFLETVTFGENSQLKTISKSAFYNCHSLNITIPSSVTSIGESAFATYDGARGIASIKFEENSQLQTIGKEAFLYCKNLAEIVIPKSVTTIGSDAFKSCNNLTIYLEQETIPSTWDSTWNSSNRPVYLFRETKPVDEGNYWHYKDEEIVIW